MTFEIFIVIEAYKGYLNGSYKLIEDIMLLHKKDISYYESQDECSWLNKEAPCRDFDFFINESIIITWHSAALIGIISILEKGIQEFCYNKEKSYKKSIKKFIKDNEIKKNMANIEILWKYIEYKWWLLNPQYLQEDMKKFKKYITDRNKIIHTNFYIFPMELYSKDFLIKICDDLKNFLDVLFSDWKSNSVFDNIDE